jgi:hypothetical protein
MQILRCGTILGMERALFSPERRGDPPNLAQNGTPWSLFG